MALKSGRHEGVHPCMSVTTAQSGEGRKGTCSRNGPLLTGAADPLGRCSQPMRADAEASGKRGVVAKIGAPWLAEAFSLWPHMASPCARTFSMSSSSYGDTSQIRLGPFPMTYLINSLKTHFQVQSHGLGLSHESGGTQSSPQRCGGTVLARTLGQLCPVVAPFCSIYSRRSDL